MASLRESSGVESAAGVACSASIEELFAALASVGACAMFQYQINIYNILK